MYLYMWGDLEIHVKFRILKCSTHTNFIRTMDVFLVVSILGGAYHDTGNGWTLATVSAWKNSVNASVGGVGILIGQRALKSLNSIKGIQPRIMVATFNGNPRATIISCYSPTNASEETELIAFYDELSSLVLDGNYTRMLRAIFSPRTHRSF